MRKKNHSHGTSKHQVARDELELLVAGARNQGSTSLEELARRIARSVDVELREEAIEDLRNPKRGDTSNAAR